MFDFPKRKKKTAEIVVVEKQEDDRDDSVKIGTGIVATESAGSSTQAAAQKFAKPTKYDRSVMDDGAAKRSIKTDAFKSGVTVKDPYTGDVLTLT